ncbi:MAG: NAD(P)-binding domain-containing protein, partial [Lachnospiraceae bacterium]|nr:NAD(P)-binding domain-containing protein [Lachnospiraceae bacterium]
MAKKVGFIGCGNMGSAILNGILTAKIVDKKDVLVSARSEESKNRIAEEFDVTITDNRKVAEGCDIIFLAVKPNVFPVVIDDIKDAMPHNKMPLIISIA